ncbi:hypothetical protein [Roseibium sp.]|uniref:hypothetical protein n=1 Tax=Roseibium sp. TaxID=1936156 RepID=UPI003B5206D5
MIHNENYLRWHVAVKELSNQLLPRSILTAGTPEAPGSLPVEVSLLLPTRKPETHLPPAGVMEDGDAAGVFLTNPFLNKTILTHQLTARSVSWLSNLPSIIQYDDAFVQQLSDVNLGFANELNTLISLCGTRAKSIVSIGRPEEAVVAAEAGVNALFVLPPVDHFETGFPSVRMRQEQILKVRKAIPDYQGYVLGLVTDAESVRPRTWPAGIDAGVIRPVEVQLVK